MNEERINEAYDYFCYYVLPIVFKYFIPIWIKSKDIIPVDLRHEQDDHKDTGFRWNLYVNDYYKGDFDLAEDILKKGTHYPLTIIASHQVVKCREGKHRVHSLQKHPEGKERYMLAILLGPRYIYHRKLIKETVIIPLKYFGEKELDGWQSKSNSSIKFKEVNKSFYTLELNSLSDVMDFYIRLPGLLNKHTYKMDNFKSSPLMNSKKAFTSYYNLPYLIFDRHKLIDEDGIKYSIEFFNLDNYLSLKKGKGQMAWSEDGFE
jgi:hypothetical protein